MSEPTPADTDEAYKMAEQVVIFISSKLKTEKVRGGGARYQLREPSRNYNAHFEDKKKDIDARNTFARTIDTLQSTT